MKKIFTVFAASVMLLLMVAGENVAAQGLSRYDPQKDGIRSHYYTVRDGYLTGILPGTDVAKVTKTCVPAGVSAPGEKIATGTVLTAGNHQVTAIVTGDVSGDGDLTITDMLMLKSAVLGEELTETAALAGDLSGDGKVSVTDFLKAKSCLLGLETVGYSTTGEEMILLTPGASETWDPQDSDIARFESSDETFATIDVSGKITAGQEGSAYVYGLDSSGNVLSCRMVTVLAEKLTLTAETPTVQIVPEQTQQLQLLTNHPVTPNITWVSSDPDIVTVEGGVVTGKSFGTATVTATTTGTQVEIQIRVVPPVDDLQIERMLYKVKPGNTKSLLVLMEPADSSEEILWSSSDESIATVDSHGVVTGVQYGTVTITATGKYSGKTDTCQVKVCNVKQVAITFDDGPGRRTDDLLDFLKENDIRVTFFLVGNRMNEFASDVRRQAAEGHELGYHSWSHAIQTSLSNEKIIADYEKTDALLYELTGQHFTLWRTPGGGYNDRVLSCVPLPHIMWFEDTLDWKTLNTYSVYRAIMNCASDGDIILLHDIHGTTVDGAIQAMRDLNAGDYEFVTVTELLSRKGTPPENGKTYFGDK